MSDDQQYEWVSVGEASRRLNVSSSTIRRMIEAGALVGEREVIGGSKERYRVRLETQPDAPETRQTEQPTPSTGDASIASESTPAITERSLEIFSAVFKGDLELIQQKDAQILADASKIADLRERIGRAEAERDALKAELERARRPWWRFWE